MAIGVTLFARRICYTEMTRCSRNRALIFLYLYTAVYDAEYIADSREFLVHRLYMPKIGIIISYT